MNDETNSNTLKFFDSLLKGQPNGVSPTDCGQFQKQAELAWETYQGRGVEGVQELTTTFQETCPPLYNLICAGPEPKRAFRFLTFDDLLTLPDKTYIIEGVLGEKDLGLLFGAPGSGKSFVVIDMAVAIALGEDWAEIHQIKKPGRIVYCAGEGAAGIKARLLAAVNKRSSSSQNVREFVNSNLLTCLDVPQLFEEESEQYAKVFAEELQQNGPANIDLLIIDTLATATIGAEENSAKEMNVVLAAAKYLRGTFNCAVLLIHHTNKMGDYRGSTTLHGAADVMFRTKVTDENRSVECYKSKDAEPFSPLYFVLRNEPVSKSAYVQWIEPQEKPPTNKDEVLDYLQGHLGKKFKASEISDALGAKKPTVSKNLKELSDAGHVQQELLDPGKKPSSHNPMYYWIEATESR